MKRIVLLIIFAGCCFFSKGQSHEMKQLLLNLEKLSQFKAMLNEMYDGYKMLSDGYGRIKNIAEGNFNIHHTFLDGLLKVSPSVKRYKKVADIVRLQGNIISTHRKTLHSFRLSESFTDSEIDYFENVYRKVLVESFELLEEMILILTDGQLRMSDDERMKSIDRVHQLVLYQNGFLVKFNKSNHVLMMQREKEIREIKLAIKINGSLP